ncbi:hypothetical protein FRC14_004848 [Serendipita sp. 396]|nr:hypothetical protein FRC14_004848 [Serendipita sp. 396]KAG8781833.1 hypothetical protein FRC15_008030 [Serendipita sp. 397]KAG8864122.1 hypothetical protein FRC20_010395 [Serendipita sp. 405]
MSSGTKKVAHKRTRSDEDKIRTLSEQLRQFDPNQIEQLTRLLGPKQKQPRLESREHTDGSGNEEECVLRVPEDIADTPIPELRVTAAELEITDRYSSEFQAAHDEAKKAIENLVALKEGADLYKSSSKQQKQLRKTAEKVMLQICAANKTLHSIQLARRSTLAKSSKQAKNYSRRVVEDEDEDAIPSSPEAAVRFLRMKAVLVQTTLSDSEDDTRSGEKVDRSPEDSEGDQLPQLKARASSILSDLSASPLPKAKAQILEGSSKQFAIDGKPKLKSSNKRGKAKLLGEDDGLELIQDEGAVVIRSSERIRLAIKAKDAAEPAEPSTSTSVTADAVRDA